MIEGHSLFDGFAANSVRCLNEVSSQGELADKRSVKKASMEFVFRTIICGSVSIYMSITLRQTLLQIKISSPIHPSQPISPPAVHQTEVLYYTDNTYHIHFP